MKLWHLLLIGVPIALTISAGILAGAVWLIIQVLKWTGLA